MYTVKIQDAFSTITKPGYKGYRKAEDICRRFGRKIADMKDNKLVYARVYNENGLLMYDLTTDTYWDDRVSTAASEKSAA